MSPEQIKLNGLILFASDYSGFQFGYDTKGKVSQIDSDGGETKIVSESIDDFINNCLLGAEGETIFGSDWLNQLEEYGLT